MDFRREDWEPANDGIDSEGAAALDELLDGPPSKRQARPPVPAAARPQPAPRYSRTTADVDLSEEAELRRLEGGGALPGGALPGDQIIDLTDDASSAVVPEPPAEPAIDCPCGAGPAKVLTSYSGGTRTAASTAAPSLAARTAASSSGLTRNRRAGSAAAAAAAGTVAVAVAGSYGGGGGSGGAGSYGGGGGGGGGSSTDLCYKCNQTGHWARNCPNAAGGGGRGGGYNSGGFGGGGGKKAAASSVAWTGTGHRTVRMWAEAEAEATAAATAAAAAAATVADPTAAGSTAALAE
eukprot:CAMPEP_0185467516 /NCGR_PEP_ID=MMETSP1365-20130426/97268_1 /TAXON_ID=38817 /ORGANISM="Gephyrocapsa oceanica, Strain RCC1303" /LENGTH=293 /DNA_ID=CAMNT_0028074253 /DNA_START=10 /DNA_END=893 /DNA_ORIENTATION=-